MEIGNHGKASSHVGGHNRIDLEVDLSSCVEGTKYRLFLNTAFGCSSLCSYCYLPTLGIKTGTTIYPVVEAARVFEALLCDDRFCAGRNGTILSIGCYSDPWQDSAKKETLDLLRRLLDCFRNPVQVSTKELVSYEDLSSIEPRISWKGQLTIYVSCATMSRWKVYERETLSPAYRYNTFQVTSHLRIPSYLYIKPVIPGITVRDIQAFRDVLAQYGIGAVVGDMFYPNLPGSPAPIDGGRLFQRTSDDAQTIIKSLSEIAPVYRVSTEVVEGWRNGQ